MDAGPLGRHKPHSLQFSLIMQFRLETFPFENVLHRGRLGQSVERGDINPGVSVWSIGIHSQLLIQSRCLGRTLQIVWGCAYSPFSSPPQRARDTNPGARAGDRRRGQASRLSSSEDKGHREENQEHDEYNLRDPGCRTGNSGESQ